MDLLDNIRIVPSFLQEGIKEKLSNYETEKSNNQINRA